MFHFHPIKNILYLSAREALAIFSLNRIEYTFDYSWNVFKSVHEQDKRIISTSDLFQKGKIVESGSHSELISKNGYYANMYNVLSFLKSIF